MRSACLPDDLRDSYNRDDEQLRSPQTSAPDRYGKLPSAGGNNGIIGSGSNGGGSSVGSSSGSNGGSGINGSGVANSVRPYGNGGANNGGDSASRDVGGGNVSSILSSRVATTTAVNSFAMASRNACKYPCLNGGTCQGSVCACRQGYAGENCGDRKCTDLI